MINTIKTQLEFCNTPIREVLEIIKNNQKLSFINECINQCYKGKQFSQAWCESINSSTGLNALHREDKEILCAFGNVLGTTDLNGQLNICNFYISQINEKRNDAKERFKKYGKLYSAMGILSGAAIAIILF